MGCKVEGERPPLAGILSLKQLDRGKNSGCLRRKSEAMSKA